MAMKGKAATKSIVKTYIFGIKLIFERNDEHVMT